MVIIIIYWIAGKDLGEIVLMGELQEHELCKGRVERKAFTFKTLLHFLPIRFNVCRRRNGGKPEQITAITAAEGCGFRFSIWRIRGERPTEGPTIPQLSA